IDGISLTAIRTPAAAITALKHLAAAAPEGAELGDTPTILTFGAGIQAVNHIRAAHVLYPNATFEVIGRREARVASLQEELREHGIEVVNRAGALEEAVGAADVI